MVQCIQVLHMQKVHVCRLKLYIYIYIIACYEGQTKNDFFPRLSNKVNKFSRFCSSSIKLEIKPKLIMEKISLYNPYSTLVIRLCFSSI